ncbi:hypothetical protein F5141DRAFT_1217591 [Pisolithus sp. B1]|nr:hypothetical protein F5141DRAFT_1217591 [Pisolithus sp. B1]
MEKRSNLALVSSVATPTRTPVLTSAIKPDDVVILITGKTECGINNFINQLTKPEKGAEKLSYHTDNVCAYKCYYAGQRFVLAVTSGLNNGELLQGAVFRAVATWLEDAYRQSIKLTGVIYTHSITDNIMSPADVRSFKLLYDLCGDKAADGVRLVTTMLDESKAVEVEETLKKTYCFPHNAINTRIIQARWIYGSGGTYRITTSSGLIADVGTSVCSVVTDDIKA